MSLLDHNFTAASPRMTPPTRRAAGPAIWAIAVALFAALFAQAFVQKGVAAWAVGLVYILYDTALVLFVARRTTGLLRHEPVTSVPERLSAVAIIAAYNEAPVLKATIEALRNQENAPDMVLVADDGSDDDTGRVLSGLYGFPVPDYGGMATSPTVHGLRWLRLPRGGKASALNIAIGLLDADIVVTVDADTLLAPGAFAAMRDAFGREPSLVAATGVLHPICGTNVSGRIFQWFQTYEYIRNFLSRHAWAQSNSLLLVSGAFAGFRRDALMRVGGFDPNSLVEDYEVLHRLHRFAADHELDWRVKVVGGAQASTDSPGHLLPFLRQRRRWFAGFLQTQWWNRDMIGNRRYGALGTAMLPVKALDTVQPLYGLAAFALLLFFIVTGNLTIALPVVIAMVAKVIFDLAWLLWSLRLYRRWTGHSVGAGGALLAAIVEPFTFQLLRHAGAAWGWYVFLARRQIWGVADRRGMAAHVAESHDRSADGGSIA